MAAKLGLFSEGAKGEGSFFTRNLSASLFGLKGDPLVPMRETRYPASAQALLQAFSWTGHLFVGFPVDVHDVFVRHLYAVAGEHHAHHLAGVAHQGLELVGSNAVVGHLQVGHATRFLQTGEGGQEVFGFRGFRHAHCLCHADEAVVAGMVLNEVFVIGRYKLR